MHHQFLKQQGWEVLEKLPQDGSSRSYMRVQKNGSTAILAIYTPQANTLPYYMEINSFLAKNNIRTPEIYAVDLENGLAIMEDFGALSMKAAIAAGHDRKALYSKAFDILAQLRAIPAKDLPPMRTFTDANVHFGTRRVIDWYLPATTHAPNANGEVDRYFAVWEAVEKQLDPPEQGFIHVDFHAENLHVLEDGSLGVIDFQDPVTSSPLYGPVMYDLSNLLYDMRMEVSDDIRQIAMADLNDNQKGWLRLLATRFHCRLLGQCIRWALVDNKPGYLKYLPRLENYVKDALCDPVLSPLKSYFDNLGLDFTTSQSLNLENTNKHIAPDAF